MKKLTLSLVIGLSLVSAASFANASSSTSIPSMQKSGSGSQATVNELLNQEMSNTPAPTQKGQLNMQQIKAILAQEQQKQASSDNAAAVSGVDTVTSGDKSLGDTGMSQQAFANMVRSLMPLSPDQIRTLRQLFNRSQQAAATSPGTPPRPTSTTVMVSLAPGATPPVIRLSNSFVSSLVFLDSTGQPWPIQAYDIGDPNSFNVQWNRSGNTLLVQPTTNYKSGNIAVMLRGKDTPIMVTLIPGQHAVDYRADLRIPGFGPNAKPTTSSLPSVANPSLLTFLNGIPPQGAKQLQVTGGPAQAWSFKGKVYIRTSLTLLSPSWVSSMSSPDGTHVYEITKTPIVLASYQGQMIRLNIQGAK